MYKKIKLISKCDLTKKSVYNNIIRSILYRNMPGYGVKSVQIITNSSMYENTYLCDRIEQIPFKKAGTYHLKVENKSEIYTNLFNNREGVYENILILNQDKPVDFEVDVVVVENCGLIHSKYCPIQLVKYTDANDIEITLLDYVDVLDFKTILLNLV